MENPGQVNPSEILEAVGPAKQGVLEAFLTAKPALDEVEARIRSRFTSDAEQLSSISNYLLDQGGKRIRPLLAVLSYRLFGKEDLPPALVDVAAGIELIHMATLLHDDIIDESPTRRHQRSAYAEFGLMPSLLSGDFLLVRAFGLCALLDDFIIDETEKACVALTEGEILEGTLDGKSNRSVEEYIDIVGKKTAALFALAGAAGSHLAGASPESTEHVKRFGYNAGVAFQMVDDILDIAADEDLLGKPAGTDLRQKTPSLVNITWLASGDKRAAGFFSKEKISAEESKEARELLLGSAHLDTCRELAKDYAARAMSEIVEISTESPDPATHRQLQSIIDYTLERCL